MTFTHLRRRVPTVRAKPLLLAVVALALAGCGSSLSRQQPPSPAPSTEPSHVKPKPTSRIAIPNMDNRSLARSYALLRSKGLRVSVAIKYVNNRSEFPVGSLVGAGIQQTIPAPGTRVAPGSVVTLIPGSN